MPETVLLDFFGKEQHAGLTGVRLRSEVAQLRLDSPMWSAT